MKIRSLLLLAGLAAAIMPSTSQAADQCDSPIYVFSRTRVQTDADDPTNPGTPLGRNVPGATSSAVGCTVVRDTVAPGPDGEYLYNTDIIYPGSNRIEVRLLENGNDPSILSVATVTIGEDVVDLEMKAGTDVTGAAAPWLDSQSIPIDPAITLGPLTVVADFCLDVFGTPEDLEDDLCYSRIYNTAPAHELP